MGFDVFGLEPRNDEGGYFRRSAFHWPGLWAFVTVSCKDVMNKEEADVGFFNNGLVIEKERSLKIAERLERALRTGEVANACKAQEEQFPKGSLCLKPVTEIDVKEFMKFCRLSGGFAIW